jgi:type 1 glutamine amidotransferase
LLKEPLMLTRRCFLAAAAGLTAGAAFPFGYVRPQGGKKKRLLFFSRSQAFQHDTVNLNLGGEKGRLGVKGKVSHADQILHDLGAAHGFEVVCTKDGRIFVPEEIDQFDAIFFYTQGDIGAEKSLDGFPPVTPEGKKVLLETIENGKGFGGAHCAADTFHSPGHKSGDYVHQEKPDPYIQMIGGEFISHGAQQKAMMRVTDPHFPGCEELKDFSLHEEWYSLKNFAPDLHVILAQDNEGMKGRDYQRPPFPATWARRHGKGRVFYTSMGHREDVWTNKTFQTILLGGLSYIFGNVNPDVTPNMDKVTPLARKLDSK